MTVSCLVGREAPKGQLEHPCLAADTTKAQRRRHSRPESINNNYFTYSRTQGSTQYRHSHASRIGPTRPPKLRREYWRLSGVSGRAPLQIESSALRHLLFMLGIVVALIAGGTTAKAQNYPWCAVLNMGDATYNCGFVTREQCMATVSGIGGFCQRNDWYQPPPGPHQQKSQAHY
jgi:Protein of unknown function (DUF3551)